MYLVTYGAERGSRAQVATIEEAEAEALRLAIEGQAMVDGSGTQYPWTVRMTIRDAETRHIISDWTAKGRTE